MATKLVRYRKSAFIAQSGRCFYCELPIWEEDPESFAHTHKLTQAQARWFQSTAEHLKARQDNGKDVADNIVAACLWCNHKRHMRKIAPNPNIYKQLVKERLGNGQWHSFSIKQSLKQYQLCRA